MLDKGAVDEESRKDNHVCPVIKQAEIGRRAARELIVLADVGVLCVTHHDGVCVNSRSPRLEISIREVVYYVQVGVVVCISKRRFTKLLPSGEVRDPISAIASYFPKRLSILLIYDVSLPAVAAFTMR